MNLKNASGVVTFWGCIIGFGVYNRFWFWVYLLRRSGRKDFIVLLTRMPAPPFPGSHLGVDSLDGTYRIENFAQVNEQALGDDAPVGERPDAGKARLAFEGATESYHTSSRIAVHYQKGAALMSSSYDLMVKAADDKQKFSNAVLNIRNLALEHPLLAGEIHDVLAPVYMIVQDTDNVIGNAVGSRDFVDGKDVVRVKAEGQVAALVGNKRPICNAEEADLENSSNDACNPEKRISQRRH